MMGYTDWTTLVHEMAHHLHYVYRIATRMSTHPRLLRLFRKEAKRLANVLGKNEYSEWDKIVVEKIIQKLQMPEFIGLSQEEWDYLEREIVRHYGIEGGFLRPYAFYNPREFFSVAVEAWAIGDSIIGGVSRELGVMFKEIESLLKEVAR